MCRPLHFSYSCGHSDYRLWLCLNAFIEEGDVNAMCPAGTKTAESIIRRFDGCDTCARDYDLEMLQGATALLKMRYAVVDRGSPAVEIGGPSTPSIVVESPSVDSSSDLDDTITQVSTLESYAPDTGSSPERDYITSETSPEPETLAAKPPPAIAISSTEASPRTSAETSPDPDYMPTDTVPRPDAGKTLRWRLALRSGDFQRSVR
ncbi:hypothetical protein FQN54_006146 [Arachnomyces sp. PD_36]|nr:hypothetical protein FQN54_006146 [Arachnomyces sp. PD_36]